MIKVTNKKGDKGTNELPPHVRDTNAVQIDSES